MYNHSSKTEEDEESFRGWTNIVQPGLCGDSPHLLISTANNPRVTAGKNLCKSWNLVSVIPVGIGIRECIVLQTWL